MRADTYQIFLITAGIIVTLLLGLFFYREMFPEYRIYQQDYIALDKFHASYSHQPATGLKEGVKQIVIARADNGPAEIDRCISCHVALQIPYFSPTIIAKDLNDQVIYDENGKPLQIQNEYYIWQKLDEKISELRDPRVLAHLQEQKDTHTVKQRLSLAEEYESLKTAHVGHQIYDVTKVLKMHPLIGNETRPFEFHPLEEYGCVSCHSGNGRGLVTDRAHGPVFDGQYEEENEGPIPEFLEKDAKNDPRFSKMFNGKPGNRLIFQTTPLLVDSLIQAKCIQCHQTSSNKLTTAVNTATELLEKRDKKLHTLVKAYEQDKQALFDLLSLNLSLKEKGYAQTLQNLQEKSTDYTQNELQLKRTQAQIKFLTSHQSKIDSSKEQEIILAQINNQLIGLLGSELLVNRAQESFQLDGKDNIDALVKDMQTDPNAKGTLFLHGQALDLNQDLLTHAKDMEKSFTSAVKDQKVISALNSDIDELTQNYQRGKDLYLSQACYACHRIAGHTRGGIGPELTRIGDSYPWYIKQSIVWPQADLATSTMPNMRLDHLELQDLMTFLLAQKGSNRAVAETLYRTDLLAWEAGKKLAWEKPIAPAQIYDTRYAMTVFATEGCASCHRLQGFESNVGFQIEKSSDTSFDALYEKQQWFKKLFPEVVHIDRYDEELPGSHIVTSLETYKEQIDAWIVSDVREGSILEEIQQKYPQTLESFYSNFRYASRAKNDYYDNLIKNEKDPDIIEKLQTEKTSWKDRVQRVLMMYIQTYGLGRLIGPHLNWSGIYRSDQWLMEHFHNPAGHIPRSIMPIFPFDDTKFYALTHMLDTLSIKNRQVTREIWKQRGFDPKEAFDLHCAQCHGMTFYGNGAIAQWLYPLPKNLRNSEFLRNLTKEQIYLSIMHGVKGTPMPPWGEIAQDKPKELAEKIEQAPVLTEAEIRYLVDWLFSSIPGNEVIKENEVPKWNYGPEDIIRELREENFQVRPDPETQPKHAIYYLPKGENLYASLENKIYHSGKKKETIEDVFDVLLDPSQPTNTHYYIKKECYTPFNLEQGREFFLLNCAVCHGNEGDGTGPRAEIMRDAKPRMLNGLDWINSKDDIYLLRSIKYGVSGTSMTPWGDLTNPLQRLQLVMYIRSLSEEQIQRDKLINAIYSAFESSIIQIDKARTVISKKIEKLNSQLESSKEKKEDHATRSVNNAPLLPDLATRLQNYENIDEQLQKLKSEVKREKELYFNLGMSLLNKKLGLEINARFLKLIQANANSYLLEEENLVFENEQYNKEKIEIVLKELLKQIDLKIQTLEKAQKVISGKISSATTREESEQNQIEQESLKKMKNRLISDTEEALRSRQMQAEMLAKINTLINKWND